MKEDQLIYVELITGYSHTGPAWIGRGRHSKSGRTIYFRGMALRSVGRRTGGGAVGNYIDIETGDEYWVSGVKKSGEDRHRAGSGKIEIDETAVCEYLDFVGEKKINSQKFSVVTSFPDTDPKKLHAMQNQPK